MKALQKVSKFLSDYTSVVVIAIAVVTFFVPTMMGWVNNALFVDPVSNKFTCQSIIIGVIMFSMGLTLTTEDFKILAQRPFDICIGAIAQYLIMPFLAFALTKALNLSLQRSVGNTYLFRGRILHLAAHRTAHIIKRTVQGMTVPAVLHLHYDVLGQ